MIWPEKWDIQIIQQSKSNWEVDKEFYKKEFVEGSPDLYRTKEENPLQEFEWDEIKS